ncbi:hypothetical protein F5878DRAFT_617915 [Lentinula raphanica]|uniref:Uncharacterized protein n=1 Tax=Lentinula raphanica TaxID=153919 RepID=A0AA38UHZ9_9AGAR|nr:hypothetical protein F5878DRAFT_617915 [Lentinula raphanica]
MNIKAAMILFPFPPQSWSPRRNALQSLCPTFALLPISIKQKKSRPQTKALPTSMNRFKLFFVLRSGIVLIFLASTISPATEALAAPINFESKLQCLPSTFCFLKFSCGDGTEETNGAEKAVPVPSPSDACNHKVHSNVPPSAAIPAGIKTSQTSSSVPSAGGSRAVPSSSVTGNSNNGNVVEPDPGRKSRPTKKYTLNMLEDDTSALKEIFTIIPGFWEESQVLIFDNSEQQFQSFKGKKSCFKYGSYIIKVREKGELLRSSVRRTQDKKMRIRYLLYEVGRVFTYCRHYYPNMMHATPGTPREYWASKST